MPSLIQQSAHHRIDFFLKTKPEDLEYIVAPHIIKSYLEGDQEVLKKNFRKGDVGWDLGLGTYLGK